VNWLILTGIVVILLFSFVIFFGAPFLPTLKIRESDVLELLSLKAGQTLLELGSGDGRILRAAAKKGIKSVGYELNPLLVIWSKLLCWKYRNLIDINWGNYWHHRLPVSDGIYVFLLNPYMSKLDKKIEQEINKKVRVVSFAFQIPNKKPKTEKNGMFLYVYRPERGIGK